MFLFDIPTFLNRSLTVFIVAGFMPLSAISFLTLMRSKRERDFSKATTDMGIQSSRSITEVYGWDKYILPVVFAFLICLFGIVIIVQASDYVNSAYSDNILLAGPLYGKGKENLPTIMQSLTVMCYAFFGAFVWSAMNIVRRLIAYDVAPSVYFNAGLRIMFASLTALVLSFIFGKGADASMDINWVQWSLPVISFLTGIFPESVLGYLVKIYKNIFSPSELNTETLSLDLVEGMSDQHRVRLGEIGIDNAQNLATASLTQLLLTTPFQARQLLDWIAQAKLLVYAKKNIHAFREIGIRSVFDFYTDDKMTTESLEKIAAAGGINTVLLFNVANQLRQDPGVQSLNTFYHNLSQPKDSTLNILATPPVLSMPAQSDLLPTNLDIAVAPTKSVETIVSTTETTSVKTEVKVGTPTDTPIIVTPPMPDNTEKRPNAGNGNDDPEGMEDAADTGK